MISLVSLGETFFHRFWRLSISNNIIGLLIWVENESNEGPGGAEYRTGGNNRWLQISNEINLHSYRFNRIIILPIYLFYKVQEKSRRRFPCCSKKLFFSQNMEFTLYIDKVYRLKTNFVEISIVNYYHSAKLPSVRESI